MKSDIGTIGIVPDTIFEIGVMPDGSYFAFRDKSPRFLLLGETAGEAADKAVRAMAVRASRASKARASLSIVRVEDETENGKI